MYRYFISLIASLLFTSAALCETVPFLFSSSCDTLRHGKVVCPAARDKKIICIYVNHRLLKSEENFEIYSGLTEQLNDEGISCCCYDNRPVPREDSTSCTTMFDMADDAAAVYRALKTDKRFKNYKIGFFGVSEAGSSALIAASMVTNPSFVIQQSACVIPQIEKDFFTFTVYGGNATSVFINPKFIGMPFYSYAAMIREILEKLKDTPVGDTEAFVQTIINKYFSDLDEDKKTAANLLLHKFINSIVYEQEITDRLIWVARSYYQNVKCPILYIGGLKDTNVFGIPNIVGFEKIMLENGHKKFNTILFNINHQMLTSQEVYEEHYRQKEPVGVKRPLVWDSIKRWILRL